MHLAHRSPPALHRGRPEVPITADAFSKLLASVLGALDTLEVVGRRLHPPDLPTLVERVRDVAVPVREGLAALRAGGPVEAEGESRSRIEVAAGEVLFAFDALAEAARDPDGFVQAYRALRAGTRATEALYPLASTIPEVSRFFIEPHLRDDAAVRARIDSAPPAHSGTGVSHFANDRESRGGFSLYVPEYCEATVACPLIVALHGGSGHGADFLWTWLREARSHGAILVSPTSRGRTWSLRNPAVDGAGIEAILRHVRERWRIDPTKMLLTGMSDGGTFAYLLGLRAGSPFTHLAPSSASYHLGLVDNALRERLAGLPVYVMHGVLDWMFPVDMARIASAALTRAGARVVYREIPDLSHTYPRDENPRIMEWFLGHAGG